VWGIIGLGNPGPRYEGTRHNIGFAVVDLLERRFGVRPRQGTHPFLFSRVGVEGEEILLVKPLTYVNRSGVAVRALLQSQPGLDLAGLLVVVDDVALPFGRLRLRATGSDGGHNGLRSIEAALGSRDYARLRLGVGAQQPGEDLADHVLARFSGEEMSTLPDLLQRAADAVEEVVRLGVQASMPRVNGRPA
jgi:PTH1 family peptidyl-tRNA hydrolase